MIHYLQYLFYLYTIPSITYTFYKSRQTSTLHQFQFKLPAKAWWPGSAYGSRQVAHYYK